MTMPSALPALSLTSPIQARIRDIAPEVEKTIAAAQRIVVVGHRSPDGDAMGACLAWADYLTARGKQASVVMPNAFPDFLAWMPGADKVVLHDHQAARAEALLAQADLICLLDFNCISRLQQLGAVIEQSRARRLMVDHHLGPDPSAAQLIVSEPQASATCELVARLLIEIGGTDAINGRMATNLYCGLMSDTGAFTFNSTHPDIFLLVALFLQRGVDKDKIYRYVYHSYSTDRLRLQGYVLYEKVRFYAGNHASLFALTRDEMKRFRFIRGDGEGLVNLPLQVRGVKLSISLREDTELDVVRVSLRSVDSFPCNKMAEQFFNGGGHLNASGGQLDMSIDEAIRVAEQAIEAFKELL